MEALCIKDVCDTPDFSHSLHRSKMSDISQTSRFNQTVESEWYSCIALHLAPACHEPAADWGFLCRSEQRYCWPTGPTRSLESHSDKSHFTWYHRVTSVARTSIYLPCRNNVLSFEDGIWAFVCALCDLCIVKASQASQASLETEDPGASITTCHRVGRLGSEAEGHVSPCFYHRQGHTSEFAWETQIAQIWKSQMLQMILHHLFIIFHENVSNSVPFPGWQWITSRCHGVNRVTSCQQVMDFKVRSADDQNLQGMKASKSVSKKLRQISIKIS